MSEQISSAELLVNQDRSHVWHHLTQHKVFESNDPLVIVEGDGMVGCGHRVPLFDNVAT